MATPSIKLEGVQMWAFLLASSAWIPAQPQALHDHIVMELAGEAGYSDAELKEATRDLASRLREISDGDS
jgi:hypothetical protein